MNSGRKKLTQKKAVFQKLADLYTRMENEYDQLARSIGLSCAQCADNCCRSYFQHHTYVEWAYMWKGLQELDPEHRQVVLQRAQEYREKSRELLAQGQRPRLMCPLNEQGWCILYPYRLMICRLHGVPNQVRMPNGQTKHFPGCTTCQDLTREWSQVPVLDRTPLYIQLVQLEREFLGSRTQRPPKVDMTLAEMLVQGKPKI